MVCRNVQFRRIRLIAKCRGRDESHCGVLHSDHLVRRSRIVKQEIAVDRDFIRCKARHIGRQHYPTKGTKVENGLGVAEFNSARTVLDFGSLRRVVLPADVPPFTADEIAIYRDFLINYPGPRSQMIGMQDTTVAFVASMAFGDDPNPPNLNIPQYHGRKLPPEVIALTDEDATSPIAAAGKPLDPKMRSSFRFTLSEIAFDSTKNQAAFIFAALCGCNGGQSGTVLYKLKNGPWERQHPMLNYSIG